MPLRIGEPGQLGQSGPGTHQLRTTLARRIAVRPEGALTDAPGLLAIIRLMRLTRLIRAWYARLRRHDPCATQVPIEFGFARTLEPLA